MHAARKIDEHGAKGARNEIAYIKAVVPKMAQTVIDRAIQAHGAAGRLLHMHAYSLVHTMWICQDMHKSIIFRVSSFSEY